jgi:hypothetical protein
MEFNFYRTYYDVQKYFIKGQGLKCQLSPEQYYRELVDKSLRDDESSTAIQSVSEITWLISGRPYFKVFSELVPVFSKCPIDIPAKFIEFPYGLTAFAVYLPERDSNSIIVDEQHYVRSILVYRYKDVTEDVTKKLGLDVVRGNTAYDDLNNRLTFWMDVGEKSQVGDLCLPVYTYKQMAWRSDETIDQALTALPQHSSFEVGVKIPMEAVERCARLILSICFLAKSEDGLVVPDVLSKDRLDLRGASPEHVHILVDRAKKKGKYGWVVGSHVMHVTEPSSVGGGREFSYSHIRMGHWHKVYFGAGRSQTKIVWYRPTVVRPDLPFRS